VTLARAALLFAAAVVGGTLNAVAGGGSFITLPALLYAGIPPVMANATSTVALWPGSLSSAIAYRRDVRLPRGTVMLLVAVSVAGGLAGALLLVRTSDTSFMRLLPWLMLLAAVTFTVGDRVTRLRPGGAARHAVSPIGVLLQIVIAIYGGYFGGGMGIMMLATMTIAGMTDIHEMNGLKAMLGVAINGVALATFIAHAIVDWPPALVMIAGAITGGYGAAALARRIDRRIVRLFVTAVAWTMTIYFFLRT
jgi:uncharacterized protein